MDSRGRDFSGLNLVYPGAGWATGMRRYYDSTAHRARGSTPLLGQVHVVDDENPTAHVPAPWKHVHLPIPLPLKIVIALNLMFRISVIFCNSIGTEAYKESWKRANDARTATTPYRLTAF